MATPTLAGFKVPVTANEPLVRFQLQALLNSLRRRIAILGLIRLFVEKLRSWKC